MNKITSLVGKYRKEVIFLARAGKQTITFERNIAITACSSIAGKKESEGPLGKLFDITLDDDTWGETCWEKSESKLQKECVRLVIDKRKICESDVNMIFAGDLLNQCVGAHYGLRDMRVPFFGLYGACSTFCEGMIMGAMSIEAKASDRSIFVTSSHFCSSEKQFRLPLDYGGQRSPTAQWTVTASGSCLLEEGEGINIVSATPGRIVDMGISDASNMGTAMAPAAADTLTALFNDTNTTPDDYDLILTGDLGVVGSDILKDLMKENGYDISKVHNDAGCMIFDIKKQDVHAGGSGCGCMASVFCADIMKRLTAGKIKKMIVMATGALMNTQAINQGESIPSIAHAVVIEDRSRG